MSRPDARELLEIARQTLLHELLPELPAQKRYLTLMVANAMAIAAREYQAGDRVSFEEGERLRALLDDRQASPEAARRALAAAIRKGRYDAQDERERLLEALRRTTLARLQISNPKLLP
ncbi:DUF6285 domain-containing protein [Stutzerimonas stutzeri]|uniref:DUF6285 domain-containing protein n=1 Tax=Stutzerimonas stutzeri TaxID=316 RepID=UPI0024480AF2|nr:DUF6285 domain-containing protein [Stutzerimonas stutzeri]MDH1672834.1 DUF6285 domain-containing protein [Stutzerimonas stutzeri]